MRSKVHDLRAASPVALLIKVARIKTLPPLGRRGGSSEGEATQDESAHDHGQSVEAQRVSSKGNSPQRLSLCSKLFPERFAANDLPKDGAELEFFTGGSLSDLIDRQGIGRCELTRQSEP